MAMTLVSTVTVGSGGADSIEFTGIAGTGKDLLILISGRNSTTMQLINARFNGDSGSNYNNRYLEGTGSAASSGSETSASTIFVGYLPNSSMTANTFGSIGFYVSNYTSSVAKSVSIDSVQENNATAARQHLVAQNWTGTSAITSITLLGSFVQHSTASLYIIS